VRLLAADCGLYLVGDTRTIAGCEYASRSRQEDSGRNVWLRICSCIASQDAVCPISEWRGAPCTGKQCGEGPRTPGFLRARIGGRMWRFLTAIMNIPRPCCVLHCRNRRRLRWIKCDCPARSYGAGEPGRCVASDKMPGSTFSSELESASRGEDASGQKRLPRSASIRIGP